MGTLRMLLALSVAYGHAGTFLGFPLVPGDTAVQVFYAISGFYMALVLNEKYRADNSTYLLFIGNRFFRIFPAYAVVLLATLALAFVLSRAHLPELPFVSAWRSSPALDAADRSFVVGSHAVVLGLDLYPFLTLQSGSLSFISNFSSDPHQFIQFLVIPPAWTLGIEFSFYLIAPFLVRRRVTLVLAVFCLSLMLRMALQFYFGLDGDPWSYRFFPSELALFLLGAIGYRAYRAPPDAAGPRIAWLYAIACVCIAAVLLINRWHGMSRMASVGLLLLFLLAIPALFRLTKSNPIDRTLGELSYPIYICHFLVIWTIDGFSLVEPGVARGSTIIAVTFVLAAVLYWCIDRPIDNWRHRRLDPRH